MSNTLRYYWEIIFYFHFLAMFKLLMGISTNYENFKTKRIYR